MHTLWRAMRLVVLMLAFGRSGVAWAGESVPLESDPRWVQGSLDNGVRYVVRSHTAVEERLVIRLIVEAGSLEEGPGQAGAAFLTAMLLHTAAIESPAGKAVLSLGESLPQGVKATEPRVAQDAVMFTVTLPLANEKSMALGLRHLREIAAGVGLDNDSILRHRPQVRGRRDELVTRKDRLLAAVMPQIAPGSRPALHPALPSDAAVCALEGDDLRAFRSRRYTPVTFTLVVVGDAPAATMIEGLRAEFGSLRGEPLMDEPEVDEGGALDLPLRAAVAADPDLRQAIAEVVVIHDGPSSVHTRAEWRTAMVDRLAAIVLHRRLLAAMERGESAVRGGGVRIGPATGGARIAVASVMGDPSEWKKLVADVTLGVALARSVPATADELEGALQSLLKSLAEDVTSDAGIDPTELVEAASKSLSQRDTLLAPSDSLELARRELPQVTAEEVREALASRFPLSRAAFTLFMPDGAGTPPPIDVLAAALPSMLPDRAAPPESSRQASDEDVASAPGPLAQGEVTSLSVEPALGVSTANFSNGVRFLHRTMTGADRVITISLTIRRPVAGDGDREAPPLEALSVLWSAPAARSMSAEALRREIDAARIEVRSQVGPRLARLEVTAPSTSAREAMRLIHLLMSEPLIDGAAFERWRWSMEQWSKSRAADPMTAAFEGVASSLRAAGCVAAWQPSEAEIAGLRPETLRQWVGFIVSRGPIDAALVGDLPRDEAIALAKEFLGSLPERSPAAGDAVQPCDRAGGFGEFRIQTRGPSADSVVLIAVHGSDGGPRDEAAMDLAARVLTARLAPRHDVATGHALTVRHLTSQVLSGTPMLLAVGTTGAALSASLVERLDGAFTSFSAEGPSDAELIRARADAVEEFDRQRGDSGWWARTLSNPQVIDRGIRALARARGELIGLTSADVRDIFAAHDPRACCGRERLRVVVTPAAP